MVTERFDPRLRRRAAVLARELSACDAATREALLGQLGVGRATAAATRAVAPRDIGLWTPRKGRRGLEYVRSDREAHGLWADVERIRGRRRDARRVVLLGESVARGYFYDPVLTPAGILQQLLRSSAPLATCEVVDLARTNQLPDPLLDVMQAARALTPDAYVVFAGNNFRYGYDFGKLVPELVARLRGGGDIRDVRRVIEAELERQAVRFVDEVARLAGDVPVVVVVPEFNLVDWRSRPEKPAPLLRGERNQRWLSLWQELAAARARGHRDELLPAASQLLELDGGTCEAGLELIARIVLRDGARPGSRPLLEAVRDAELWSPLDSTPRCHRATQVGLRRAASARGLALVDVPGVLSEQLAGAPPGGRFFHDYCHLTKEGMTVVMGAVAQRLAPLLHPRAGIARDAAAAVVVTPQVEAEAAFLAAIHNDRWGQEEARVGQLCRQALRHWPPIAQVMLAFLDLSNRGAPPALCASFGALLRTTSPAFTRFLSVRIGREPFSAPGLARAVRAAVWPASTSHRAQQLRAWPTDLLRPVHWQQNLLRPTPVRALTPEGRFSFGCARGRAVRLELTYRTCDAAAGTETLVVLLNDTEIASLPPSPRWRATSVLAPASAIRDGDNTLTLRWPNPVGVGRGGLERLAQALASGQRADTHPVLGELLHLTATIEDPRTQGGHDERQAPTGEGQEEARLQEGASATGRQGARPDQRWAADPALGNRPQPDQLASGRA